MKSTNTETRKRRRCMILIFKMKQGAFAKIRSLFIKFIFIVSIFIDCFTDNLYTIIKKAISVNGYLYAQVCS